MTACQCALGLKLQHFELWIIPSMVSGCLAYLMLRRLDHKILHHETNGKRAARQRQSAMDTQSVQQEGCSVLTLVHSGPEQ